MSRNISKLSGRKGLKANLFKRMIDTTKRSEGEKEIKQLAEEYHVGVSTIHGAESFYEFLRPEHKEKKAWVCNGSACMCAGNQNKLKDKLEDRLGKNKVGETFRRVSSEKFDSDCRGNGESQLSRRPRCDH